MREVCQLVQVGNTKHLVLKNYEITELVETILKDINDVYARKYDVIYTLDILDISGINKEKFKI